VGGFKNPHEILVLSYFVCIGPMDPLELVQEKAGVECTRIHHRVQKDDHHVGYLYQEPRCSPQVSGGSTKSSTN